MATILFHGAEHMMFSAQKSFKNTIINSRPKKLHVNADLLKMFAESSEWPFEPEIILIRILVLNKLLTLLVQRVISQMHASVIFIDLGGVSFWSKSGQPFFEDVHAQRFIRCDENVDSQIEFVPVDQEGVRNVTRNDRKIVDVHIVDIIYKVDSFSLCSIGWFNNPHILLRIMLPQFLVVRVEFTKLIGKDVGVGHKVEVVLSILLLHSDNVAAESVFSGDFVTLREMVDLLKLV